MRNESEGSLAAEVGTRQPGHYRPIVTCDRFE